VSRRKRESSGLLSSVDRATVVLGCIALLAGIFVLCFGRGVIAMVVGACLVGLCGVAAVALVFLLVGESEDRERRGRD